jgi:hypothetical protein
LADRNWSATYVSVAVINSRNSSILAAVGMIVAVPAAALPSRPFVSMSGGLAAGIPATGTVTHAHRLPGAIVDFLFDTTEVTFLTRLETYRLATTCIVACYLASSVIMCKVLTDVMNVRRHLHHCHWSRELQGTIGNCNVVPPLRRPLYPLNLDRKGIIDMFKRRVVTSVLWQLLLLTTRLEF